MPDAKPKPKGKGKGLSKKRGPFPTYVWAIIGAVIVLGYIYYRRKKNTSSTSAGSLDQTVIPSGVISPNQNDGASGGTTSDSGSPNVFPSDYASQTDLATAVGAIEDNTASAIAAITFPQPQPTPSNPTPVNVTLTVPTSKVSQSTTTSKTAAKKAAATSAPTKYYTYKKNVPLKAGQSIHYTAKKGYYAA
jgi:hypothetical protein